MATAAFWQRGETIDRINDTAKTIPANTIQAIGKRIGVVAMEAAPGQKYSVNVVGVYSFPKKARTQTTQRQQQTSYRQPRRRPTRLSRIYSTPWQQQDRSAAQSDGQCPIWPQLLISSAMPDSVALKEPRH